MPHADGAAPPMGTPVAHMPPRSRSIDAGSVVGLTLYSAQYESTSVKSISCRVRQNHHQAAFEYYTSINTSTAFSSC